MPRFSHHPCPNMLRILYHSFRTSWKSISQGFVCFRLSKSEALQLCSIPVPIIITITLKEFILALSSISIFYLFSKNKINVPLAPNNIAAIM